MLKKLNRLRNGKIIETLSRKGKIFRDPWLFFRYTKNNELLNRFSVTVSKKLFKRANRRNRLRRQIQEAIRLSLPEIQGGFLVSVSARLGKNGEIPNYQDLKQSVFYFIHYLNHHEK